MKVDQRVSAEWLRDGLDPSHKRKLDPHQSQANEAKSDGEVGPETLPRPVRAHEREGQRRHADPNQYPEPGDSAYHRPHSAVAPDPAESARHSTRPGTCSLADTGFRRRPTGSPSAANRASATNMNTPVG